MTADNRARPARARNRRVLVVEDEYQIRRLLADGLTAEGFVVHAVPTGRDALIQLERACPDVVLIDLMLPDMTGIELAQRIHSRWSVHIIGMSASDALLNRADAMPDIHETITKPFDWDELVRELELSAAA